MRTNATKPWRRIKGALAGLLALTVLSACVDLRAIQGEIDDLNGRVRDLSGQINSANAAAESAASNGAAAAREADTAQARANQALAAAQASASCCDSSNEKIDRMFKRAPAGGCSIGTCGWAGALNPPLAPPQHIAPGPYPPGFGIPDQTGQESIAAIDRILQSMPLANIAFNVPQTLNLEDVGRIQLILALGSSVETLESLVTAEGVKSGATIHVADRMEARLTGANFDITAVTEETQGISATEPTRWQWDVKPKKAGKQYLHLTLSAVLTVDGSPTPRTIRTFDQTIEVKVHWYKSVADFVGEHLEWVWTALLVPVALWLWGRWKRRRSEGTPPAAARPPTGSADGDDG